MLWRKKVACLSLFLFFFLGVEGFKNVSSCRKGNPTSADEFYLHLYKTQNDVVLTNVPFGVWISFSCFYGFDNSTDMYVNWPSAINYSVLVGSDSISHGTIENVKPHKEYFLSGLSVSNTSVSRVYIRVDLEGISSKYVKVNVIPGWCSIVPPAIAIGTSIVSHQVCSAFLFDDFL